METVAEQGEDMQGYVTEIILTLESIVDSLDSDIRPMVDLTSREIFKSTPNLKDALNKNKETKDSSERSKEQQHQIHHHDIPESPVSSGHNYHISAPTSGGVSPFSKYPYDRCVSYNLPSQKSSAAGNLCTIHINQPT